MDKSNHPRQETIFVETDEVRLDPLSVEMDTLRRRLASLFERAAQAVQSAGYEQDDGLIRRLLICRFGEREERIIPVEVLADRQRFLDHLQRVVRSVGGLSIDLTDVTIVGLRVEAVIEHWP